MKRFQWVKTGRNALVIIAMTGATVVCAFSEPANATPALGPSWANSVVYQQPNSSFFSDSTVRDSGFSDFIMDRSLAAGWKQEYEDLVRWYDIRERYGLVGPEEQRIHAQQMSSFTLDIMTRIKSYQFSENMNLVRKAVERDRHVQRYRKPIAYAMLLAAAYSGQAIDIKLSKTTTLRTSNHVPSQQGYFTLTSPAFDGSFSYAFRAPGVRNPYATDDNQVVGGEEKYKVGVSRPLVFGIATSLSYGTSTSMLTGSLSREVFDNLTCVLDTSRTIKYSSPDGRNTEQSIRFMYGLIF